MKPDISALCGREISCSCGRVHFCPIEDVVVNAGALDRLAALTDRFRHILLAADKNTWAVCGERADALLAGRVENRLVFQRGGPLVPDERAVVELKDALTADTDFILGIGSGVINDLCKYVSWERNLPYGIIATAPSMDGYASSGAAMIMDGMKVTCTARPPRFIVADTDIVRNAPMDMIRAGYGDIIGKYSSLNDWRLSHLVTGEYFCQEIHDLVLNVTNEIQSAAERIVARDGEAIGLLTKALILIGVTLSLAGSTRPGSGSEHHLSHFFEIVGLLRGEEHFCHGIDVGCSTVVTASMRESIAALNAPVYRRESRDARLCAWKRVFGRLSDEVFALQTSAGSYQCDRMAVYREKWPEIRALLRQCPSRSACQTMLTRAGYDLSAFDKMYGSDKIIDAARYGKDLKNRYTVLWLCYDLFSGA